MSNFTLWAEELAMDGAISMQRYSRSSIYRWTKEINEYFKREGYTFKAKAILHIHPLNVSGLT